MLDEQTILNVAKLAKLELSDDEIQAYRQKFSEIFTLFDAINHPDISALTPLGHPLELDQPFRDDQADAPTDPERFAANSPAGGFEQGYFKVPKVIE